jgi:glycerol-3-phosphate acyltransferase PlsY
MVRMGLISTIAAYLLGSIPFGYLIVRWQRGVDVRTTGSGSIGATNVMRTLGSAGFVATFFLDLSKGLAAVLLAAVLTHEDPFGLAGAAVAAIAGHCFPLWLKFRGGKGVATALGAFLAISPLPAGLALVLFGIAVGVWRYISLGSILAATAFPVLLYFLKRPPLPIVLGAFVGAAIIVVRHAENLRRLFQGSEPRLGRRTAVGSRQ